MRRLVAIISAVALFCAGVACGWLMRGDGGGTGETPVPPDKTVDARVAPSGRGVRNSDEESAAEPQFVEAVSAEEFRRQQGSSQTAMVEEVKGEDGLTVDERMERFKRERPDEFAALQRRRESMRAARKAAAGRRQEFFDSIDLSFLTEEQRKTHVAYADALAARQEARERMAAARRTGAAVSDADRAQLQVAERVIREQGESERAALFEAVARSVGIENADDVKDFRETISAILETTREPGSSSRRH
ncbi:MAG: hypothetical protein Q4G65_09745 [bacterium]|nr:hypothetical protein [bacterium]